MAKKKEVQSSVKDESLIEKRRTQMIQAAVQLFKEKGFHRTTTREIAQAAGFSIGTLYEYIRTKEDILFLVCDNIYNEVQVRISNLAMEKGTISELETAIEQYYTLIDDMNDEFVVMYQESKSLQKDALVYVLKKELEMVAIFEKMLQACYDNDALTIAEADIPLAAQHIVIQGQMWAFRRWALSKHYSLKEFITRSQQQLLQGMIKGVS